MAILKCKMCGGDLTVTEGVSVCECDYCGTKQTVATTADEGLNGLYNRANTLRIKSEFDKAESLYEKILQNDTTQAEAYWGLILCKYGIEYVEDPKTFKRIPTCHRTSFDSVIADEDYKAALQYADGLQRSIYEAEAAEIDRLQKEILALSQHEEPYDVFICYKQTDANGQRTVDSVIANDIYHQLTQEGFKVFYAAITLEDKLGSAYEPCIFAALSSAKVMLVIGTKAEHFSAVWVKNEWGRFLKMMKQDRSKTLIPCYRDMDAYDLPEEFAHLQAQDMSKIGFISDVVRGIKKLVVKETVSTPAPATTSAATGAPTGGIVQLMLKDDVMYEGEVFANIPHGYGKAVYRNHDVYEGAWHRGQRHGQGKITWAKGGEWSGEFKDGKAWNGNGVYHYDNDRYEGQFVNGQRNGYGEYYWNDGDRYEGDWQNNKRHGQGKLTWAKGGEWEGEFKDGKAWNGNGVGYYDNGRYEGRITNGQRNGYGEYYWNDGDRYEGDWQNNNRHGQGKMIWAKGGEWSGEFQNDKAWTGKGVIHRFFEKEDIYLMYDGDYVDGKRHGYGIQHFTDAVYEGAWVNDIRQGQGKLTWNAGGEWIGAYRNNKCWNGTGTVYYGEDFYVGTLTDGNRHGQGKYTWKNGNVYEGEWNNDKQTGQGKMIWAKGGEWVGEFKDEEPWTGKGVIHRFFKKEEIYLKYEGDYVEGKRHGHGIQHFTDAVYEGAWVNDVRQGQGKLVWTAGGEWIGEYQDDKRWNGSGTEHHNDGYFVGTLVSGKMHGQGKYVWTKGGEWSGEFREGKRWNGSGAWWYSDSCYVGPWVNGIRQGQGKTVWNAGGEWSGEFRDDKRWNGSGIERTIDGYWDGPLKHGLRHGQGKYVWNKGGEWVGEFKDDKFWNGTGIMRYTDGSAKRVTTKRGKDK